MLVLTRAQGQDVVITVPPSETPTVVIVEARRVRGGEVRLAFDAGREVTVRRREVQEAVNRQIEGSK